MPDEEEKYLIEDNPINTKIKKYFAYNYCAMQSIYIQPPECINELMGLPEGFLKDREQLLGFQFKWALDMMFKTTDGAVFIDVHQACVSIDKALKKEPYYFSAMIINRDYYMARCLLDPFIDLTDKHFHLFCQAMFIAWISRGHNSRKFNLVQFERMVNSVMAVLENNK